MKKLLKIFISISCMFIIMISISGCNGFKQSKKTLQQKINTEISYLDKELVDIANKLNNIDYAIYKVETEEIHGTSNFKGDNQSSKDKSGSSEGDLGKQSDSESGEKSSENQEQESNNSQSKNSSGQNQSQNKTFSMNSNNILSNKSEIDWYGLKNRVENLYTSWTTIANDLKALDISNEDIDNFSGKLDNMAISIKNEDKNSTIENLIDMYEYLPKFIAKNNNSNMEKVLSSKYNLLKCYKNADMENWEELQKCISDLKINFSNIINNKNEFEEKEKYIDNSAIIINEMENSSELKDKKVFFIKYKNLMQELGSI